MLNLSNRSSGSPEVSNPEFLSVISIQQVKKRMYSEKRRSYISPTASSTVQRHTAHTFLPSCSREISWKGIQLPVEGIPWKHSALPFPTADCTFLSGAG